MHHLSQCTIWICSEVSAATQQATSHGGITNSKPAACPGLQIHAAAAAIYLLPNTSKKLCLAPLSNGQGPVAFLRFSYISIVVMFFVIMRQCMIRKPTIASAKAASMTKARNRTAGLQHKQASQQTANARTEGQKEEGNKLLQDNKYDHMQHTCPHTLRAILPHLPCMQTSNISRLHLLRCGFKTHFKSAAEYNNTIASH